MKRTLTAIAMSLAVVASTSAQDMYDALRFSQNLYQGTARSIAMGNAMTAVGSDLGSISINPAGSAVAGYSQFTLTPGVTLSTSTNDFTAVYDSPYTSSSSDSYSRMMLPNIGFTIDVKTGKKYGVKNYTFGFVSNVTNDYTSSMYSKGVNTETTMLGAMATNATGYSYRSLGGDDAYYSIGAPWNVISGYQAGMISTYNGLTSDYIGATEKIFQSGDIALAGPLDQTYGMQRFGAKYDMVFNLGMNINDMLFLGANLGITSFNYQNDTYFKEYAQNPDDFAIEYESGDVLYFDNARSRYSYNAVGEGVYLKIGAIAVPLPGLRIGAAIQTPTGLHIRERWQYSNDCNFTNQFYNSWADSPEGEYEYRLVSPFRFNAGVAYNILGIAMVSAEYEMASYSQMKYRSLDFDDISQFSDVNSTIRNYAPTQHMLRVGAEIKPVPEFAIRAGYNMSTYLDCEGNVPMNVKGNVNAFSIGAGYSSNGSFFADVAYRLSTYPYAYVQPYDDYIYDSYGKIAVYSPEIRTKANMSNIVATIGWRF